MITLNLSDAAEHARKIKEVDALKAQLAGKRSYSAGVVNRLTNDWLTPHTNTRAELRMYLRNIRARSRDLARNNDYMRKFLQMAKTNIVGPDGIRLQVKAKTSDDPLMAELNRVLNSQIEQKWRTWGKKDTCTVSGNMSWADAQSLFVHHLVRDGEALIRKVYVRKTKANPFGFSLKFIDVAWLDETHDFALENGNRIIMGVEVDGNDRAVAYWLTLPVDEFTYPGAMGGGNNPKKRTRVPASEIIHAYLLDDSNQTRGLPWAHTAMVRLRMLHGYEEAELVAARAGACKGGFLKPSDDQSYTGEEPQTTIESIEPGMIQELPPGMEWIEYDPKHPNSSYGAFTAGVLHGAAAGLGVAYSSLTGDLSSANFSSARIGLLEERDMWKALQRFVSEHFCDAVYAAWLESSYLTGAIEITMGDYEAIQEPTWQPRGWQWVDPVKDVQATILAINNGLATRTDALAAQGQDFEETVLMLAQEKLLLDENGVELAASEQKPSKETAPAPDAND